MIEYRPFHNTDPPRIMQLWNSCSLGPGAALDFSNDALDMLVLAEPYFDKRGLIVACDGKDVVGFVHAGFGANAEGTGITTSPGLICAVMVAPLYRRQGIGRELVSRAETYLRDAGAKEFIAGESDRRNPFYLGLYGGAECAGFLQSDPHAAPFFDALGYTVCERHVLLRREVARKTETFDPRLVIIRRAVKMSVIDHPPRADWWWMTRHGRFESLTFALVSNAGGAPLATLTCWGMELHAATRSQRLVGMTDLYVSEKNRRKGYGKALILDVIRRLKEDLVTHVEVVVPESDPSTLQLFTKMGFEPFDVGAVYRRA